MGDLVDLLELPKGQRLYPPQTVTIHRVINPGDGQPWRPRAEADVLLLGDSFSNIYGTPDLDWGEAAGFPAQLARFLNRDVDAIARSGSGATATRWELRARPGASRPRPYSSGNSPSGNYIWPTGTSCRCPRIARAARFGDRLARTGPVGGHVRGPQVWRGSGGRGSVRAWQNGARTEPRPPERPVVLGTLRVA